MFLDEAIIWSIGFEVCEAVKHLHQCNIIHRDIKCLNIFLTKDKHVKLGDLGVSKIISQGSMQVARVGTPLYLAPELIKQQPYDFKVDVWALGCVLYTLATLESPFQASNLISLGHKIINK